MSNWKFKIKAGIPEMREFWKRLRLKYKSGTITKPELGLYKKLLYVLGLLRINPRTPKLETHEISVLSNRYGQTVWQSDLERNGSLSRRILWVFDKSKPKTIVIIGITSSHPNKKSGYKKINLSDIPEDYFIFW